MRILHQDVPEQRAARTDNYSVCFDLPAVVRDQSDICKFPVTPQLLGGVGSIGAVVVPAQLEYWVVRHPGRSSLAEV